MRFQDLVNLKSELEIKDHGVFRVKSPSTIRKIKLYKILQPLCLFRNYISIKRRQF